MKENMMGNKVQKPITSFVLYSENRPHVKVLLKQVMAFTQTK